MEMEMWMNVVGIRSVARSREQVKDVKFAGKMAKDGSPRPGAARPGVGQ